MVFHLREKLHFLSLYFSDFSCNEKDAKLHDRHMQRYLKTGKKRVIGIKRPLVARRKDGSEFHIELGVSEVNLPDGKKVFCGYVRDRTQERLDKQMIRRRDVASPTTPRGVQVSDIWMYHKINTDGTMVNTFQEMVDPQSRVYSELVRYAEGVCRAVGIKYGMAHVEIKAEYDEKRNKWINPVMVSRSSIDRFLTSPLKNTHNTFSPD